jgi:hypothetical protein
MEVKGKGSIVTSFYGEETVSEYIKGNNVGIYRRIK